MAASRSARASGAAAEPEMQLAAMHDGHRRVGKRAASASSRRKLSSTGATRISSSAWRERIRGDAGRRHRSQAPVAGDQVPGAQRLPASRCSARSSRPLSLCSLRPREYRGGVGADPLELAAQLVVRGAEGTRRAMRSRVPTARPRRHCATRPERGGRTDEHAQGDGRERIPVLAGGSGSASRRGLRRAGRVAKWASARQKIRLAVARVVAERRVEQRQGTGRVAAEQRHGGPNAARRGPVLRQRGRMGERALVIVAPETLGAPTPRAPPARRSDRRAAPPDTRPRPRRRHRARAGIRAAVSISPHRASARHTQRDRRAHVVLGAVDRR